MLVQVHASYSLPDWQAVKLIFFAQGLDPCKTSIQEGRAIPQPNKKSETDNNCQLYKILCFKSKIRMLTK